MAISSAIQKKIETLKKGLNNKFITAAQKEKIKAQVEKLESQSKASSPKKATKPAASSSLTRLQKLVKNKKYGVYKGAGVDLKKDSDRPAKAIGKRIAKSGKTYYEYRANRIDVKQPPKRYPKLEKGGYMADGGRVKGRNNETGETYGVVIGSVKKSDENIEGGTEMNVRKGYSSRISEVKLVFDKNANLYEITDYGYALEGNYPDTSRGSGRNYNADKKETLEILSKKYNPAFAKKLIELAKNPKMAEGGMTEHGLRIGDKITTDMFWDNQIVVENTKTNKRAQIDLETGKRKDEMEKGGYMADGGEVGGRGWSNYEKGDRIKNISELKVGQSYLEYNKQFNSKNIIRITSGDKTSLNRDIVYAGFVRDKNDKRIEGDFAIWGSTLDENEIYEIKEPKMADGGVTEKEVVESNADMVLSQIKAVKHHAEELSSVVSRKSNIEAWVVGKIERASTDLSDITHYLEGNKDKMSMGGTVRYYAHKMDKK